MTAVLRDELWTATSSHFVSSAHAEVYLGMVVSVVVLIIAYITSELKAEAALPGGLTLLAVLEVLDSVSKIFLELQSAAKMISDKKGSLLKVQPRVRRDLSDKAEYKKCVTFSIVQLITVWLTASKEIRQLCIAESNEWKKGELYGKVPEVYSDVKDGRRFRNSELCKKATPAQRRDLRIGMHGWNDALTSGDGMATKAKENKWEAVLVCLINLPLWMRHYFDHLLLVALFQAKWGERNGGIVRVLCGVTAAGVKLQEEQDAINLASEIEASKARKIIINLPDDDDPTNTKGIDYHLILDLLLISLDWLANGAFGPFAESVSAHRPCFKCHWTDKCACAWIGRTDPRNETLIHSAMCRRKRLRTHDETLEVVGEMRLLNATKLKLRKTEEGIFSIFFASEYLLGDIVKDATIDLMHVLFSSGIVLYKLSWLLDIYIPPTGTPEFTWGKLNSNIKTYNGSRKGHHIPKLKRSGKDDRGAAKMSLTAAEAMEFTINSREIMGDLVVSRDTPHWLSWMALVALVKFAVRREYSSASDPQAVQVLYDDWMMSVEKVKQWVGRWKPKFHLGDHLQDALKVRANLNTGQPLSYAYVYVTCPHDTLHPYPTLSLPSGSWTMACVLVFLG